MIQFHPQTAQKGWVIVKAAYEARPRKDHRDVGDSVAERDNVSFRDTEV